MSNEIVVVPDIGADEVEVIEICVAVGDQIEVEQSLVVLESDKASMEVPSPMAGKVVAITLKVGDNVSQGAAILELAVEGAVANAEPAVEAPAQVEEQSAPAPAPVPAAVEPAAVAESKVEQVTVPDLGGAKDVECIEVCIAVGDEITAEQSLIVLETDKASMEIPSPSAGTVVSIAIKTGDTVNVGDVVLELQTASSPVSSAAPVEAAAPAAAEPAPPAAPVADDKPTFEPETKVMPPSQPVEKHGDVYAGPAVRMLARDLGVDLTLVKGSGPRGRIAKEDLQEYVKARLAEPAQAAVSGSGIPAIPAVDFAKFGPVREEKLSKMGRVTAENMSRSWLNVPHVTQFDDADITELEDFRNSIKADAEKAGVKVTPLPFLLKACAAALKAHPKFNASLSADGQSIVYKDYVHIGIAVDTPAGLVVPVIRDVDQKSIYQLAAETAELGAKAKDRKLTAAEMQGGCFTISSLGNIGGTGFTPIVNAPEVAILGVSKLDVKPVWNGKEFIPRKMLPLSLSYDHRVINGADAGRFFTQLGSILADIRRLVL
jgi:pyruvate dehydrogenase E2 component (dihydrolipoamide acetyltransferase)